MNMRKSWSTSDTRMTRRCKTCTTTNHYQRNKSLWDPGRRVPRKSSRRLRASACWVNSSRKPPSSPRTSQPIKGDPYLEDLFRNDLVVNRFNKTSGRLGQKMLHNHSDHHAIHIRYRHLICEDFRWYKNSCDRLESDVSASLLSGNTYLSLYISSSWIKSYHVISVV